MRRIRHLLCIPVAKAYPVRQCRGGSGGGVVSGPWRESRFRGRLSSALLGLCVGLTGLVQVAQAAQPQTRQLGDIVVTGTRSEKQRADAPVRTEVVDQAEIRATGARTLKEALANLPGVQLQELHGKSGYQLVMQGFGSDQVLVLIDGLPISASTSSSVDLSQYLLSDVERIEVVKGASSAQYGSSAMGGVINVITRTPDEGLHGGVQLGVGSRGKQNDSGKRVDDALKQLQLELEGGGEHLRGRVSLERLDDDGFGKDPAAWARQGDRIRRQQATGRVWWRPVIGSEWTLALSQYSEDDVQRFSRFFPPVHVPQRKTEAIDRDRLVMHGRQQLDHGSVVHLSGVHERYDTGSQTFSNGLQVIDRVSRQRMNHLSLQWDLPPLAGQMWQWGGDLHQERLSQRQNGVSELTGGDEARRSSRELFLQGDVFLTPQWELLLGVRWQYDSDFGFHWAPKLAVSGRVYEAGTRSITLRASAGQGYRVPNLKERHYLFDHSALGYKVTGSPGLRPESSNSLQLGAVLALWPGWTVDVNAYYNRVKDLIQVDRGKARVDGGVASYGYENVARARTKGLETELIWSPSSAWRLNGALTFGKTRDLTSGTELTRRPERIARLGVDWRPLAHTALTMRLRHQSSELVDSAQGLRSDAWTTVDLGFRQQLAQGLTGFLKIDNVFNEQRNFDEDHQFGPLSGRLVMIGLRYGFGNRSDFE
ncbi:MAG: TonB-dependent receptor [Lautropia sp.]|nr:TonB-dependent receptor [Lautropia sp.]